MPSDRAFAQVDVFTTVAGLGNPVAVVLDGDDLDDAAMQRFANWTNLSETTFVLPATTPGADYRLRIFTPSQELPFAGHPTIGTARALQDAGRLAVTDQWVQECAAGLVTLRRTGGPDGAISFTAPPAQISAGPLAPELIGELLGGPAPSDVRLVTLGPAWLTGRLDLAALDSLTPDGSAAARALDETGVGLNLYAVDDEKRVHVCSFFTADGVLIEDPVCGSGNAAVGVHLRGSGLVPDQYEARQGRHRGRDGRIAVDLGDGVSVGGQSVVVVRGTVTL